jgi:L-serine dehydratase
MFLSVFDIFKIGIGPSSSHTVGPMVAVRRFVEETLRPIAVRAQGIRVSLHGSLAFTGKGHGTDRAIALAFAGERPETIDPDRVPEVLASLDVSRSLGQLDLPGITFDPEADIAFDYGPPLPGHTNGMTFTVLDGTGAKIAERIFYSVGGGFILAADELAQGDANAIDPASAAPVPYPFATAAEMLAMGERSGLSVAEMKRVNEKARAPHENLDAGLDRIWSAMESCMNRGLSQAGTLPGGLKVKRRAADIHRQLTEEHGANSLQPHRIMDWLSVYAMAVNEENASGGRVVTAPTNGAAGVIPAVIRYYLEHCVGADREGVRTFLLVAAAVGGIIKHNASISGAEVGCQGEVGSASAMAAAGLAAALGATNAQIENAAEIALEHHLGMTCDPIGGLVQVPCIERNALGAVKAVSAASLALRGDGSHFVPLDNCIETMRQTGADMSDRYKETSKGGLAVNVVAC